MRSQRFSICDVDASLFGRALDSQHVNAKAKKILASEDGYVATCERNVQGTSDHRENEPQYQVEIFGGLWESFENCMLRREATNRRFIMAPCQLCQSGTDP